MEFIEQIPAWAWVAMAAAVYILPKAWPNMGTIGKLLVQALQLALALKPKTPVVPVNPVVPVVPDTVPHVDGVPAWLQLLLKLLPSRVAANDPAVPEMLSLIHSHCADCAAGKTVHQ